MRTVLKYPGSTPEVFESIEDSRWVSSRIRILVANALKAPTGILTRLAQNPSQWILNALWHLEDLPKVVRCEADGSGTVENTAEWKEWAHPLSGRWRIASPWEAGS